MSQCKKPTANGYNCVVCIKQVPDTKMVTGGAMRPDGTINRSALPAIFNPEDRNALEAALRVRDAHGGTVTVVTMGLPAACTILREALECGADKAYLITDRRAAASDTLATSYILSQAVRKLEPDLVFCGRQAIDGDTAQVGPQIAEKLGFALLSYVEKVDLDGDHVLVTRNIGTGIEKDRTRLPALLTLTERFGDLRPYNARLIMAQKKARAPIEIEAEVKRDLPEATDEARAAEVAARTDKLSAAGLLIGQWTLDDIDCDLSRCGRVGSPTMVNKVESVVLAGGDYQEFDAGEDGVNALVASLIQDHTIG